MNIVKFVLVVLSALVDLLVSHMKEIEKRDEFDADGVPLDDDYNTCGFLVASFRDVIREFNETNENENEK